MRFLCMKIVFVFVLFRFSLPLMMVMSFLLVSNRVLVTLDKEANMMAEIMTKK